MKQLNENKCITFVFSSTTNKQNMKNKKKKRKGKEKSARELYKVLIIVSIL